MKPNLQTQSQIFTNKQNYFVLRVTGNTVNNAPVIRYTGIQWKEEEEELEKEENEEVENE